MPLQHHADDWNTSKRLSWRLCRLSKDSVSLPYGASGVCVFPYQGCQGLQTVLLLHLPRPSLPCQMPVSKAIKRLWRCIGVHFREEATLIHTVHDVEAACTAEKPSRNRRSFDSGMTMSSNALTGQRNISK
jgi:hypothetical protein